MKLQPYTNTPALYSTGDTFYVLILLAHPDRIVLDDTTCTCDTTGRLVTQAAAVNLPLSSAERLRDLLNQAIDHAASMHLDSRQTALWSNPTIEETPSRFGRRA